MLTFEWWYTSFYCIFLLCTQLFKGYGGLYYPESVWSIELASIAIFFWFQLIRIDWGCRANRTENKAGLIVFLFFTTIALVIYVYFTRLTTYVLRIEYGFGLVGCFFPTMEFIFTLISIKAISSSKNTL